MVIACTDRFWPDLHGVVVRRYLVLHHLWLFGIFVIPFRLLTRSGRNRKRNKLQHRELLEAIRDGKMNKTAE